MSPLHALRSARLLARLVLVWFALSIGVAMASPLVSPQSLEMVCTGSGAMKLLLKNADGTASDASGAQGAMPDCPLCATHGAPLPAATATVPPVPALGHVLQTIPAARIAALTAAPPPGRGPPSRS